MAQHYPIQSIRIVGENDRIVVVPLLFYPMPLCLAKSTQRFAPRLLLLVIVSNQ
jgi:hypothetical protein